MVGFVGRCHRRRLRDDIMSPNETFALAVLNLIDLPAGFEPLVRGHRPDFDAIHSMDIIASTGERALLLLAQDAWTGAGICGLLGRLDGGKRADVVRVLVNSYTTP